MNSMAREWGEEDGVEWEQGRFVDVDWMEEGSGRGWICHAWSKDCVKVGELMRIMSWMEKGPLASQLKQSG